VKRLKFIKTIINGFFFALVISVALFTVFSNKKDLYGWRFLTVNSGSMEPTIKVGSLILIKRESDYKKGDIVTFSSLNQGGSLITHKIIEEIEKKEGKYFKTKGDFNETEDMDLIPKEMIIGKYQFGLPFLGYPLAFAKTQAGFSLMVVVPATLIIYNEFLNIRKELKKLRKNRSV
jgi:signal peptidase